MRIVGPMPGKDASEFERLRFTRALGLKLAVPFLPVLALAVITVAETWAYVALGVWAVVWVGSLVRISLGIRRAR